MTDEHREYEPDNWDKFGDIAQQMWVHWYSWGRDWRYQRSLRKLATLIAKEWEEKATSDDKHSRFTLTYYASQKRQYAMTDTDYVLHFFVNGFTYENKTRAIHHIERLLWLRFNMHPADAFNQVMVPEIEEQILHQIISAIPQKYKDRYTFTEEALPVYTGDWEMQPGMHHMASIVAVRKED